MPGACAAPPCRPRAEGHQLQARSAGLEPVPVSSRRVVNAAPRPWRQDRSVERRHSAAVSPGSRGRSGRAGSRSPMCIAASSAAGTTSALPVRGLGVEPVMHGPAPRPVTEYEYEHDEHAAPVTEFDVIRQIDSHCRLRFRCLGRDVAPGIVIAVADSLHSGIRRRAAYLKPCRLSADKGDGRNNRAHKQRGSAHTPDRQRSVGAKATERRAAMPTLSSLPVLKRRR
jgi:hypothetical protein